MGHSLQSDLLSALGKIDRPSTFCTRGILPAALPGLAIEGIGPVGLPLTAAQAKAIRGAAHQAPYGKGTETLVDTNIRRVWELDARQFSLDNPAWIAAIASAVSQVQADLGIEKQKLQPHLYKLLLYEKGSFFLPHRDGEKLDRMVATMVVTFPSAHQGGELVVRHEGREVVVDFAAQSKYETQFAAFYADCEHEVRALQSGYRLSLVYNLTLAKGKRTIEAPRAAEHVQAIAQILTKGEKQLAVSGDAETPCKLAVLLDHQYSKSGLAYDALKGTDRAKADVLFAAAAEAGWDAYLSLVELWESGSGEPIGGYDYHGYRGRSRYYEKYDDDEDDQTEEDDDGESASPKKKQEYTMQEVIDSHLEAAYFRDANGRTLDCGPLPVRDEEIVSQQPLGEGIPDEEEFEGYTGNAGMTLDRWYRRAAIVLWPKPNLYDVLLEAGHLAAAAGLAARAAKLGAKRVAADSSLRESCIQFARKILQSWPEVKHSQWFYENTQKASANPWLTSLELIGDRDLTTEWITRVLARDASIVPGKQLGDLFKAQGWRHFQKELDKIWTATTNETLQRNAQLLSQWCLRRDRDADRLAACSKLAKGLMKAVEEWRRPTLDDWRRSRIDWITLLPALIEVFVTLEDEDSLFRLHRFVRDRKEDFDITEVQLPVWLNLESWLRKKVKRPSEPLLGWWKDLREELHERALNPPQAPRDWRRPAAWSCKCKLCADLRSFLTNPSEQVVRFPLAKHDRQHLHQVIDRQKLDTTHVTERKGRPFTLVLKKTSGSYDRAVEAHRVDTKNLQHVMEWIRWMEELDA